MLQDKVLFQDGEDDSSMRVPHGSMLRYRERSCFSTWHTLCQ